MASDALKAVVDLWSAGHREAATQRSTELLAQDRDNEQLLAFHSGLLLHQSRYEEVLELLGEASSRFPGAPNLLVNLSIAQRATGDLPAATASAEQAVRLAPGLLGAWNAFGLALIAQERWPEAEEVFRQGLGQHPDNPALQHHLDQVLAKLGKPRVQGASQQGLAWLVHAEELSKTGNPISAEAMLRQAVQLNPNSSAAHSKLGIFLMRFGRSREAVPMLEKALEHEPACPVSRYFLRLAQGEMPAAGASDYVQVLFDTYAEQFDQHLVIGLDYKVPELLLDLLREEIGDGSFGEVLDLGCGTGLMGPLLAPLAEAIDGVDLSGKMLEKARARTVYRHLGQSDIRAFLQATEQQWQTVVAADVFCYCGRLEDVFAGIARRLAPGGVLAFSVEASDDADLSVQGGTGRYQHSRSYIEAALKDAGFELKQLRASVLRQDGERAVPGLVVLARR